MPWHVRRFGSLPLRRQSGASSNAGRFGHQQTVRQSYQPPRRRRANGRQPANRSAFSASLRQGRSCARSSGNQAGPSGNKRRPQVGVRELALFQRWGSPFTPGNRHPEAQRQQVQPRLSLTAPDAAWRVVAVVTARRGAAITEARPEKPRAMRALEAQAVSLRAAAGSAQAGGVWAGNITHQPACRPGGKSRKVQGRPFAAPFRDRTAHARIGMETANHSAPGCLSCASTRQGAMLGDHHDVLARLRQSTADQGRSRFSKLPVAAVGRPSSSQLRARPPQQRCIQIA